MTLEERKQLDELEERVKLLKDLEKFEDPGMHVLSAPYLGVLSILFLICHTMGDAFAAPQGSLDRSSRPA